MEETLPTSQLEAAKLRLKHYQGEPCAKGHSGIRYTVSRNCVECTIAASKAQAERIRKLMAGESPA